MLLKQLKAGRFLSTLINVKVDGTDNNVICRGVQRDVVKDLPTHVDFLRLTDRSRIALFIPVEYVNREKSPGPAPRRRADRGAPRGRADGDRRRDPREGRHRPRPAPTSTTPSTSRTSTLPAGTTPTITDRDFVIANIQAPSGLRSEESEEEAAAEG